MEREIIGYSKFTSKKGNQCCILRFVRDVTDNEKNFGSYGMKAEEIFVPENQINLVNESILGKKLVLNYTCNEFGAARLENISIS